MTSRRESQTKMPESRRAPEPEGPDEVYRRFQRTNRRGVLGGLSSPGERLAGSGKKMLYGALVAVEIVVILLGTFFEVPYMDTLALVLPGLLVVLLGDSKEDEASDEDGFFERLLKRLGGTGSSDERPR